jgi:Immunity protein 63
MSTLLDSLQNQYKNYCAVLAVDPVFHTSPVITGGVHTEHLNGLYYYVMTEGDIELDRRGTASADEMLYWLMSDAVFDLASKFALTHRQKGESSRRLLYAKELELMGVLNSAWVVRKTQDIEALLARNPYDDSLDV